MLRKYLEAGKIVGTHGIKGELRVEPWCDSAEFLTRFSTLYWDGGTQSVQVLGARVHKNQALLRLDGVTTVEQADVLRGRVLFINREDAVLPKGAHFIQDLVGARVLDAQDESTCYGTLTQVFQTGANDVYEVTDKDKRQYLVPVIPQVVKEIDVIQNVVKIKPLKGIFDDED